LISKQKVSISINFPVEKKIKTRNYKRMKLSRYAAAVQKWGSHLVDESEGHPEVAALHLVPSEGEQGAGLGLLGNLERLASLLPPLEFEAELDVPGAHVDGGGAVLVRVALLAPPEVAVALARPPTLSAKSRPKHKGHQAVLQLHVENENNYKKMQCSGL